MSWLLRNTLNCEIRPLYSEGPIDGNIFSVGYQKKVLKFERAEILLIS